MTEESNMVIDDQRYKDFTGSDKVDNNAEARMAKIMTSPIFGSGFTAYQFLDKKTKKTVDGGQFICEISRQAKEIAETNEMDFGVKMLVSQAKALDTLFNTLARRAGNNMGHYIDTVNTYMKLALKAQAQSRSTWEAISKIKNPPNATFVNQANIAHGNQQVNNGPYPTAGNNASRKKKTKIGQTNYWRNTMANGWTMERRQRQAELIKTWKPWQQSTGPQTEEGKAKASRNAFKGGVRPALRSLTQVLREQHKLVNEL